jgi:predicted RNA binding protein YcfA (HicA-like mRNA interferase family)
MLLLFKKNKPELLKSSELLAKLKKAGWYEVRQTGSHKIPAHTDFIYTITFPYHGSKEMKTGTANSILKQAGLK